MALRIAPYSAFVSAMAFRGSARQRKASVTHGIFVGHPPLRCEYLVCGRLDLAGEPLPDLIMHDRFDTGIQAGGSNPGHTPRTLQGHDHIPDAYIDERLMRAISHDNRGVRFTTDLTALPVEHVGLVLQRGKLDAGARGKRPVQHHLTGVRADRAVHAHGLLPQAALRADLRPRRAEDRRAEPRVADMAQWLHQQAEALAAAGAAAVDSEVGRGR